MVAVAEKWFTSPMQGYGPETYGDRIAAVYDDLYDQVFDKEAAATFLAERAGKGPALELAIGTGRVALPLRAKGVQVEGIDASEQMVARLREKPGGAEMKVTMGDFADVDVEGSFKLIYIVFNTLFALQTQEDQIRCFTNVAEHLKDSGVFVLESFVPDLTRFERHQGVNVNDVELDEVMFDVSRHDPVTQTVKSQHIFIRDGATTMYPVFIRYTYPPEMDLMARLAGLALRERYANFKMDPFTSDSKGHVSVYGRA